MASRLRSRQVICITGSIPAWHSSAQVATLLRRTMAVWLSVMLTASHTPLQQLHLGAAPPSTSVPLGRAQLGGDGELRRS
jgi:fructose-1-phosphate kinase PfkB-like protein